MLDRIKITPANSSGVIPQGSGDTEEQLPCSEGPFTHRDATEWTDRDVRIRPRTSMDPEINPEYLPVNSASPPIIFLLISFESHPHTYISDSIRKI